MVVTRVRPEKSLEKNDDLLSDEEFLLHYSNFLDTIFTRVGQTKHFAKRQVHADELVYFLFGFNDADGIESASER